MNTRRLEEDKKFRYSRKNRNLWMVMKNGKIKLKR